MKTIPSPRRALNVLIAPSGFKESLSAEEVADRIAEGVLDTMPGARVTKLPMADGGEGFTQALVNATGGTLRPVRVTGPVGAAVDAFFGLLGGRTSQTAVIEMAAAAGSVWTMTAVNPAAVVARANVVRIALETRARRNPPSFVRMFLPPVQPFTDCCSPCAGVSLGEIVANLNGLNQLCRKKWSCCVHIFVAHRR